MTKLLCWLLRVLFGYRTYNTEVLQTPGPVLLLSNHVSWFDWLLLGAVLDNDWKFVTSSATAQLSPLHRLMMTNRRCFPVDPLSPYAARRMAEHLQARGRLVLFPEGRISTTGSLMKLFDGTGFLLHKTHARVITCHLRGAFRLPFSRNSDKKQLFPRVSAHFSKLLTPPQWQDASTAQARTRLTDWLRDEMLTQQFRVEMEHGPRTVPEAIFEAARRRPGQVAVQDVTQALTYRRLLVGARLLGGQWNVLLPGDTPRVGVLLPNVNAMPVTLLSLWLCGRVPAILNYSTGAAIMLSCTQLAGLKQVITSRVFLQRAKLNLDSLVQAGVELIYLEDVRARISGLARGLAFLNSFLRLNAGAAKCAGTETAAVLFTSGSEGVPKGVELTHTNLLANVRQMQTVCDLQEKDLLFNALPLFHSFGLVVGTLLPLIRGFPVYLYPSPLHYRVIPTVIYNQNCTLFLATNTFLNGYARKAHPYDFLSVRYLFAAAEKVQEATSTLWAQRFGVRILEGYGATECSPAISVNTPLMPKHGTGGRLLPGIEYKLETIEGVSEGGRLLVRGPNVMKGYLNPEPNAKFQALGGWYDTGDIASVDEDRFVHIHGRLKRFAKISGEMVSLTAVEDALAGAFPRYGLRCQVAVVSRPDVDKGEVLIAVANEPRLTVEEMRTALKAKGLPNLCVPREVKYLREIPKLGTGKVNHRELSKLI